MTHTRLDDWNLALAEGSFEQARAALEDVVAHLEAGQLSLAESLDCYEIGVRLADRCDRMLAEAELRISGIDAAAFGATDEPPDDATAATEPLEMFSLDDVPF